MKDIQKDKKCEYFTAMLFSRGAKNSDHNSTCIFPFLYIYTSLFYTFHSLANYFNISHFYCCNREHVNM